MISKRRMTLYGVTAATLGTLFCLPLTGWVARQQARMVTAMPAPVIAKALGLKSPLVAEKDPMGKAVKSASGFEERLGWAAGLSEEQSIPELKKLALEFPNEPSVQATLLRTYFRGRIRLNRTEEKILLYPQKEPSVAPSTPKELKAEDLADFEAAVLAGEKSDPDNLLFPFYHAILCYAQHQDVEGDAYLIKAAALPHLREYLAEEVEGRWKLSIRANKEEIGSVARTAQMASILFPQYSTMRATARFVTARAVEAELAGRMEEGLALRRAMGRLGMHLRADSYSAITGLVGVAITSITEQRPGGAELLPKLSGAVTQAEKDARVEEKARLYREYLTRIGHAEEATWWEAERQAGIDYRKFVREGMDKSAFGGAESFRLMATWGSGFLTLASIGFLLVLGAISALAVRFSRRVKAGEPMPAPTRWGVVSGLLTLVTTGMFLAMTSAQVAFPDTVLYGVSAALALTFLIPPILGRYGMRGILFGLLSMLLTVAAVGVTGGFLALMFVGSAQFFSMAWTYLTYSYTDGVWQGLIPGALAVLIPLVFLLTMAISSLVVRVPITVGIARGIRGLVGPVCCVMLLGYAALIVMTGQQETKTIKNLTLCAREGEIQGMARAMGHPAPALTPEP